MLYVKYIVRWECLTMLTPKHYDEFKGIYSFLRMVIGIMQTIKPYIVDMLALLVARTLILLDSNEKLIDFRLTNHRT